MAQYTPSRTEQAASPKPARERAAQAATRHTYNPRYCSTCPAMRADPDSSYTNRVMGRAEHPLMSYTKMLLWDGGTENPSAANDRFLAFLDRERRPRAQRRDAVIDVVRDFVTRYPVMAQTILESLIQGRSDRSIAEELGLDHHTVARMLGRGQVILHQLAVEAKVFEVAC